VSGVTGDLIVLIDRVPALSFEAGHFALQSLRGIRGVPSARLRTIVGPSVAYACVG